MMDGLFPGLPLLIRPPPRFTALPAQGDLFFQDFHQPRVAPGLLHEIAYAVLHGRDRQTYGGPSGHGYHRGSIRHLLQVTEHIQTFPAGRSIARVIQVHEEKIELAFRQGREQVRWGAHGFKDISVRLEKQLQSIQHVLLIVGNENSAFGRLRIGGCLGCDH